MNNLPITAIRRCQEIINGENCNGIFKIGQALIATEHGCFSDSDYQLQNCLKCTKCGYSETFEQSDISNLIDILKSLYTEIESLKTKLNKIEKVKNRLREGIRVYLNALRAMNPKQTSVVLKSALEDSYDMEHHDDE